jgi:hypothetical protein
MQNKSRESLLKIGVAVVVGLFLLDRMVLGPATESWKAQGERLSGLREKVLHGRQLLDRAASLRGRWNEMENGGLAEDRVEAEKDVLKAVARWTSESQLNFSSFTPQWRTHDEGYDTYEVRAAATGSQAALGRLLYEIESDPLPARLEDCELVTRDSKGKELVLSLKFSFVRIANSPRNSR